jgi:proteic killer suppression protein
MKVSFSDDDLARVETDPDFSGGYAPAVVKAFRKVMGFIRSAADERDFYQMRSLRFEKLSGQRRHERSMRVNDQYRLIVELEGDGQAKTVRVITIEDYH